MQNKLQELTDKLYNEGLSKGKTEGEELLRNAKAESEKIIAQAHAEAKRIIDEAQKNADDLKNKVTEDVKLAAIQSITITKQEMEKLVVAKMVDVAAQQSLSDANFVKELIKSIVSAFNPANSAPVDLDIILPESLKGQVEGFVSQEIKKLFGSEVQVSYSKKIGGGFKISPKGSDYILQFTDTEFTNLISAYLRPATKKILFG